MDSIDLVRLMKDPAGRLYGVYPARVVDNLDPDELARLKVAFPWDRSGSEIWARLATLWAGPKHGSWFIPDVNDEVLVAFAGGDPREPFIVGSTWSKNNPPPDSTRRDADNSRKTFSTRSGIVISMDDEAGEDKINLETPEGQKITLKDEPSALEIIDSNGNSIKLETGGITVTASAKVTVNASIVEVSAGMVIVNAGMARFSGVVQADTVIANSVVSASYTPGAGNIM